MENVYQAMKMCGICLCKNPDSHSVYVTVYSWKESRSAVPGEAYLCKITDPANMLGKVVEANYDIYGFVNPQRDSDMAGADIVQLPHGLKEVVQEGKIIDITEEDFNIMKDNCYRPENSLSV